MTRLKTLAALALAAVTYAGIAARAETPAFPPPQALKFDPPKGEHFRLKNGLTVWLLPDHTLPAIRVCARIKTGQAYDPENQPGLAQFALAALRSGGTAALCASTINGRLDFLGATLETSVNREYTDFDLFSPAQSSAETLGFLAQLLQTPAFESGKAETERNTLLDAIARRADNPLDLALQQSRRMFFGPHTPYGHWPEAEAVKAITAADLKNFHARYFAPNNIQLAVAGAFETHKMKALLEKLFGSWRGKAEVPVPPSQNGNEGRKVFLISKAAASAPVVITLPAPRLNDPKQYAFTVLNQLLGGQGMSSRLFIEVRTVRGLAYYAGSSAQQFANGGALFVYAGTKNPAVPETARLLREQIANLAETPVTDEELTRAKNAVINSYLFEFATPIAVLRERMLRELYGFPPDYPERFAARITAVTAADVQAAAREFLRPQQAQLLVVGDEKQFSRALADFGQATTLPAQ